jgi:hypothetical protein
VLRVAKQTAKQWFKMQAMLYAFDYDTSLEDISIAKLVVS